ncbi:MAG TPA: NAD-dependent epimerase/dehydratase family protein [Xanthobacteraceae bacterium]|nr:NAD-dependent epimerase/dehydratase family protein [Xanthobacteraceae bacterium]
MQLLVTGSSGLIGSEAVEYFARRGHHVHGLDNNMRADFFGPQGDTTWRLKKLLDDVRNFTHHGIDIRDRAAVTDVFAAHRIGAVIHCAAQPSHDLAKDRPFDDFDVNATGTLNLLEAARRHCPEAPFVFMSTNKVYGDVPNELPLVELPTRWDYADPARYQGIDETMRIDQSKHSLFGASKAAADLMVQEYGRYFGMPTACFRGGCLTGPNHSGVELHGFLSFLVKTALRGKTFTIFGYKGKQVRDQIHSLDVVRAFEEFIAAPRVGEVYNLGGGRESNASILECFDMIETVSGRKVAWRYDERNREGDHICYISDMGKFRADYPRWSLTRLLPDIIEEMVRVEALVS